MDVQWIEMAYNLTEANGASCGTVCAVDGAKVVGTAEVV
jgi:hypothetical protein